MAALEQLDAEPLLRVAELVAERGRRQVELAAGRGQAARVRDRGDQLEVPKLETHPLLHE